MSEASMISAFKKAMQELAASVNIVTTEHSGVRNGLTATAVCSLSMEPAAMLVCINKGVQALEQINDSGQFCINILNQHQQSISDVFAGRSGATANQRFDEAGQWSPSHSGIPMLDDALANVVCKLKDCHDAGTHYICIGHVTEVRLNNGQSPLIYAQQKYCTLTDLS